MIAEATTVPVVTVNDPDIVCPAVNVLDPVVANMLYPFTCVDELTVPTGNALIICVELDTVPDTGVAVALSAYDAVVANDALVIAPVNEPINEPVNDPVNGAVKLLNCIELLIVPAGTVDAFNA